MPYDNLQDIKLLLHGTCSFAFEDMACIGDIQRIEYEPLGPGILDFDLVDIRTVEGKKAITLEAHHRISLLFANVTDHPREMIIEELFGIPPFGKIWSFRCKD